MAVQKTRIKGAGNAHQLRMRSMTMGAQGQEMRIRKIRRNQVCSYIPLQGWDQVRSALKIYEAGIPKGSNATALDQLTTGAKLGGAVGMNLLKDRQEELRGKAESFVDKILAEAQPKLAKSDIWQGDYEYNAPPPFLKTLLEVMRLEPGTEMFALGISAAYVGRRPEESLAKHLRVSQALINSTIRIETEPVSDTEFGFDLGMLMRKLCPILGESSSSSEAIAVQIVRVLMATHHHNESPAIRIYTDGNFMVSIRPWHVGRIVGGEIINGMEFGDVSDGWRGDGPKLYGPLSPCDSERQTPGLVVTLRDVQNDGYYSTQGKPIYEVPKKRAALAFAKRIERAIRSL